MSKRMTRVLSLILTLVMFVSVSTPAFAWGGGDVGSGWGREIGEDDFRDFTPADEVEEEKEEYDYFQTDGAEGFQVTVEAPMGSLPTLAELRAEPVEIEDVREAVESVVEGEANILVAMDISFWMNGVEIEPEEAVRVKISAPELTGKTNLTVVHIPDAEEPETVDLLDEGELSFALGANEVAFRADSFSVYAVIGDEGDPESRLTVNFYGMDQSEGAAPVATVYVKNGDVLLGEGTRVDTASYIEDIVFDPGVGGTLPQSQIFLGWSIDSVDANNDAAFDTENYGAGYTTQTKPYTIGELRSYLGTLTENNAIKEGDVLNVYAMIFKVFKVTYTDYNGIVLASYDVLCPLDQDRVPYTITENYTAVDDSQHFDGWFVDEGSDNIEEANFEGSTIQPPYPQNTSMYLKGNVSFSTEISSGAWLVFEANAYGATYNAPVFVKTGETANDRRPELSQSDYMICKGYDFDDWYVLKDGYKIEDLEPVNGYYVIDDEHFERFTGWNEPVEKRLVLYAKWNVADTTKYTVIVWKQSVLDSKTASDNEKTYEYAFSEEANVASLTAISQLDLSGYNDLAETVKTIGEKQIDFNGFYYRTTEANNTVKNAADADAVNPNGTTILNVYYDRQLVTYEFYAGHTFGKYVKYDELYSTKVTGWWYYKDNNGDYKEVYLYAFGSFWSEYSNGSIGFKKTVYAFKDGEGTDVLQGEPMTGLYGQTLKQNGYTWPSETYRWYTEPDSTANFSSFEDVFGKSQNPGAADQYLTKFYGRAITYNAVVRHYLQQPDLSYPTEADVTVNTVANNGMRFRSFQGYEAKEFRIKLPSSANNTYQTGTSYRGSTLVNPTSHTAENGWTDWLPVGTGVEYDGNTKHEIGVYAATAGGIEFRYELKSYDLIFIPGRFVDKDQATLPAKLTGTLKQVSDIPYAESLAPYAKDGAEYFDPDATELAEQTKEFVFVGWYIDETCTIEAKFDGSMPAGNMTVYGKWQQKEYRVFLHPNAGTDPTLSWGSTSQQMNFKVAHDNKISLPTGRRTGYEFLGWYTDEATTKAYSVDTRLNDDTVPADPFYDKTVYMTENADGTDMDAWGNLKPDAINKDVNRPWVQRMLNLYAKWSETLDGAEGIGVEYDPNNTVDVPFNDGHLYKDNVDAVALSAPTNPAPDRVEDGVNHPQKFLYWVMQTWDESQGKYVDLEGEQYHKYPGETFTVLKANARMVDLGSGSKSYTVRLRAEWGDVDAPTPTHIDWYSNLRDVDGNPMTLNSFVHTGSTSNVENKGWVVKDEGYQINEDIDIRSADTYSYPGYHFLGWAKKADATTDELFLKWVEAKPAEGDTPAVDAHYEAYDSDANKWVTVTQVAADEKQPYDDLYAIWQAGVFYIYHSSNNTVEKISALDVVDGKYDLAAKIAPNTLYGGYYTEYGGASEGFDAARAAEICAGTAPYVDEDGTPYTLAAVETALQADHSSSLWNWEKACSENGHAMTPEVDTVYYLKEVPDGYLKPYTQYTYYTLPAKADMLGTVWCVLGVDDLNYQSAGFAITAVTKNGEKTAIMRDALSFWPESNENLKVTLTCKDVYGSKYQVKAGFLGYAELNEFAADSDGLFSGTAVIQQYWKTKDGITVYGTTQRVLSFGDGKYTSLKAEDSVFPAPAEP